MSNALFSSNISIDDLREAIMKEYTEVAQSPDKGYHFHTGRQACQRIGYDPDLYASLPEENIASFAGTGNPFCLGSIESGETVVDVGSGAGFDALIASTLVGSGGRVVGIDMTDEMLDKARKGAIIRATARGHWLRQRIAAQAIKPGKTETSNWRSDSLNVEPGRRPPLTPVLFGMIFGSDHNTKA